MQGNNWIKDIDIYKQISMQHLSKFISLWGQLNAVALHDENEDCIAWKFTTNGNYTAGSAYKAQFFGSTSTNYHSIIWKAWAPPKCKHLSWLVVQNRLWTLA